MFDFGIDGYVPHWLTGASALTAAHGDRLGGLVGRVLTAAWWVWDLDDEWFNNGPVLLDFDGEQVEINHQKLADLSVTWNSVDPARPVTWPLGYFRLAWRPADFPRGEVLRDVELLEWTGHDAAFGMVAVGFVFADWRVTIHNALDENGLEFTEPDRRWRRLPLGGAMIP